jgi:hypothetical protein
MSNLILIVDHTTSGGQKVGEGFFVGNNIYEMISEIQELYKESCQEYDFRIYTFELGVPINLANYLQNCFEGPLPDRAHIRIELGKREVYEDGVILDNQVYFPLLEDDMMAEPPKELYLYISEEEGIGMTQSYEDTFRHGEFLVPIREGSTVLYSNNY